MRLLSDQVLAPIVFPDLRDMISFVFPQRGHVRICGGPGIMAEQRDAAHISATVIIFVMFMILSFSSFGSCPPSRLHKPHASFCRELYQNMQVGDRGGNVGISPPLQIASELLENPMVHLYCSTLNLRTPTVGKWAPRRRLRALRVRLRRISPSNASRSSVHFRCA